MIKPLVVQSNEPIESKKIQDENNKDSNEYADNYPEWSLIPKNQLINRVKRNA